MHERAITQPISQCGAELTRQSGRDAVQRASSDDGGIELGTYKIDIHKVPVEMRGCSIGDFYGDESGSFIMECIPW